MTSFQQLELSRDDIVMGAIASSLPFVAFTICSRNFLAQAQLLHGQLRQWYPGLAFYVALCDDMAGANEEEFPFEILSLTELGIPSLQDMSHRYNITELNTAIKPFVFLALFERHPGGVIAYFDPDIYVLSRFEELESALAGGADCVLTPHLLEPAEFAEMNDRRMLQFGIYNLGFCVLRDTPNTRRVAAWWGRRLETDCVIDLAEGLFVDQKWADLLPAFIANTTILRHPGYNVAYWNLSQRTVRSLDGNWTVNGSPLRFFHFSGSVVDDPAAFTRHSYQFRSAVLRDVAELFEKYRCALYRYGRETYRAIPYAFSWNGRAGVNEHTPIEVQARAACKVRQWAGVDVGTLPPHLPLLRASSVTERNAIKRVLASKFIRHRQLEADLIPTGGESVFSFPGHCVLCGEDQNFRVSFMYSTEHLSDGRRIPNWREHMDCPRCGFVNRLRATMHVLFQEVRPRRSDRIYVTEQVTPFYAWLRAHFDNVTGSEYRAPDERPGSILNGIRHEDIQRLSFDSSGLDLIISLDVLEHVPDYRQAFAELARCLRPGGTLLFTVPFRDDRYEHEVRAVLEDSGTIRHLLEPEYHGNPIDPEQGSLCFRYYGWKMLDELAEMGLEHAEGLFYWSARFGYLGPTSNIFIARKAK
jgi:hypothetical protein